jgi:hypothetical protein
MISGDLRSTFDSDSRLLKNLDRAAPFMLSGGSTATMWLWRSK